MHFYMYYIYEGVTIYKFYRNEKIFTSGTSSPFSIILLSSDPRGDPDFTSARSKSPELRCVKPYFFTILSHCVPLPDPGPPETKNILGTSNNLPLSF